MHIYIHHSVVGTTMERKRLDHGLDALPRKRLLKRLGNNRKKVDGIPHLRVYRMQSSELAKLTQRALAELQDVCVSCAPNQT